MLISFRRSAICSLPIPRRRSCAHWLEALAARPAKVRSKKDKPKFRAAPKSADEKRARRATANRILNVLKAILNRAFHDGLAADDIPWRKVKPFAKADEARIRFLTDAEAVRLINACPKDLRASSRPRSSPARATANSRPCRCRMSDLLTISKLLGHADTRITNKHYAHLADRTLSAAATKPPSFTSSSRLPISSVW